MSSAFDLCLPKSTDAFRMSAGNISVKTAFLKINGCVPALSFVSRSKDTSRIGGMLGQTVADVFESPDLRVTRDMWTNGSAVLYRYRILNRTAVPLEVENLRVFHAEGAGSLDLGGIPAGKWAAYLDQDDAMDGIPSAVRVGELDDDYVMSRIGAVWDLQEILDEYGRKPHSLKYQPYGIFHAGESVPDVLLGFLTNDSQLEKMELVTDENRTDLQSLSADCILRCQIMPGEERATEYFTVFTGADVPEMIRRYWDRVGNYYNIPEAPKAKAYAVGCTWHYYGGALSEQVVLDNINAIVQRHIPLDVYMIDDCWEQCYGDWYFKPDVMPNGMRFIADRIREHGLKPGIWTAPFAAQKTSKVFQNHPEWFMKNSKGEYVTYFGSYVLDLTFPGVLKHIEDMFRRLHDDYGFEYYKIDFTRCEFSQEGGICHDRSKTVLEAYRMGVETIRRAIGPDSFLCVCGGHYGASVGLADTQRNSGDTYGKWGYTNPKGLFVPVEEYRVKQTCGRLPLRRLWHTNADGMIVRLQEKSVSEKDYGLSVGILTDDEALMSSVVHYMNGGILMCGESLVQICEERLALYRHVIPSVNTISFAADPLNKWLPSKVVTHISPVCRSLPAWNTISIINLGKEPVKPELILNETILDSLSAEKFLVYDNITGRYYGMFSRGGRIQLDEQPSHSGRIVKIIPAFRENSGDGIYLLGTDLHHSGGGVEIAEWKCQDGNAVHGRVETPWTQYPVRIAAIRIAEGKPDIRNIVLKPGEKEFSFIF